MQVLKPDKYLAVPMSAIQKWLKLAETNDGRRGSQEDEEVVLDRMARRHRPYWWEGGDPAELYWLETTDRSDIGLPVLHREPCIGAVHTVEKARLHIPSV